MSIRRTWHAGWVVRWDVVMTLGRSWDTRLLEIHRYRSSMCGQRTWFQSLDATDLTALLPPWDKLISEPPLTFRGDSWDPCEAVSIASDVGIAICERPVPVWHSLMGVLSFVHRRHAAKSRQVSQETLAETDTTRKALADLWKPIQMYVLGNGGIGGIERGASVAMGCLALGMMLLPIMLTFPKVKSISPGLIVYIARREPPAL